MNVARGIQGPHKPARAVLGERGDGTQTHRALDPEGGGGHSPTPPPPPPTARPTRVRPGPPSTPVPAAGSPGRLHPELSDSDAVSPVSGGITS